MTPNFISTLSYWEIIFSLARMQTGQTILDAAFAALSSANEPGSVLS